MSTCSRPRPTTFKADPATAAIFLKQGRAAAVAATGWCRRTSAQTLRQIAEDGAAGFYKGPVGAARSSPRARPARASSPRPTSTSTQTRELAPIECDYRGYHVVSAPPPSSGGVVICEILNILEGYPLKDWGFRSAQAVHYQIEAMRHAYVDRNSYLGDPGLRQEPARPPARQGLRGEDPRRDRSAARPASRRTSSPASPPHEGSNTTHYSIVDGKGNAVVGDLHPQRLVRRQGHGRRTGVLLNDEMDDFTAKLGVPNIYGLVQGEANAIAPGKRPL